MKLTDEQKRERAETRQLNQERKEAAQAKRAEQQAEFCGILLELMKSENIADTQKAKFAEIYAKATHLIF